MNEHLCPRKCPKRNATCHIDCPDHQLYRADMEEERKKQHYESAVKSYQADQKLRAIEITKHHKTWKRRRRKT